MEPFEVADAVVEKLEAVKSELTYQERFVKSISVIAEKPNSNNSNFTPPWIGVAYFYEDEGERIGTYGIHKLPVTIAILCSSTPGQISGTESLKESVSYARKVANLCKGEYIIGDEILLLRSKTRPIEILQASASLSITATYFEYDDQL